MPSQWCVFSLNDVRAYNSIHITLWSATSRFVTRMAVGITILDHDHPYQIAGTLSVSIRRGYDSILNIGDLHRWRLIQFVFL